MELSSSSSNARHLRELVIKVRNNIADLPLPELARTVGHARGLGSGFDEALPSALDSCSNLMF